MTHGPTIPMQPATLRDIAAAVNVKHAGGTSIEGDPGQSLRLEFLHCC